MTVSKFNMFRMKLKTIYLIEHGIYTLPLTVELVILKKENLECLDICK